MAVRLPWPRIRTVLLDMDGTLLDLRFDNQFWRELVPERYARRHGLSLAGARAEVAGIGSRLLRKPTRLWPFSNRTLVALCAAATSSGTTDGSERSGTKQSSNTDGSSHSKSGGETGR